MKQPWTGEFPREFPREREEMDAAAIAILLDNMRRGRSVPCEHVSVTTPDGNGAYCAHCGETLA